MSALGNIILSVASAMVMIILVIFLYAVLLGIYVLSESC